jgi:uncharacterized protein
MNGPVYAKETPDRGWGLFAGRHFAEGEVVTKFDGPRVRIECMEGIPAEVWDHLLNVGPVDYMIPREPEARTNHSCDPNTGLLDDIYLVARRDIGKDEEITFDYSTTVVDDWHMECQCGAPCCRGFIGKYRDLPESVKAKYDKLTPAWIKGL